MRALQPFLKKGPLHAVFCRHVSAVLNVFSDSFVGSRFVTSRARVSGFGGVFFRGVGFRV